MAVHHSLKGNHDRLPAARLSAILLSLLSCVQIRFYALTVNPALPGTMELTFCTELGETYAVEIDENMELENVMALLEVEVSPVHVRSLAFDTADHCCPYHDSCVL